MQSLYILSFNILSIFYLSIYFSHAVNGKEDFVVVMYIFTFSLFSAAKFNLEKVIPFPSFVYSKHHFDLVVDQVSQPQAHLLQEQQAYWSMVVWFVALEQCTHHRCHSLQVCLLHEPQEPTRKGGPAKTVEYFFFNEKQKDHIPKRAWTTKGMVESTPKQKTTPWEPSNHGHW